MVRTVWPQPILIKVNGWYWTNTTASKISGALILETVITRNILLSLTVTKGQLISKANCQAVNSSKKRTNEFVFTTMQRIFVRFLEEIEDTKKTFRN